MHVQAVPRTQQSLQQQCPVRIPGAVLFHAVEQVLQLLAGELFAGERFSNNGKTGRWHAAAGRRRMEQHNQRVAEALRKRGLL